MLSENPPPDPSCSYQFPLLNSNSDERASASDHKPPQELDLPNSNLHHHPNFSIRDYVFTARSKDIKKNWPFSLKNLQLCLEHGVKDLLPPLKPLRRCVVETSSVEKEKTGNNAAPKSNSGDPQLNYKLVDSCLDTSSSRTEDENDFPSTTTSVLDSEIESLAVNRLSTSQKRTYQRISAAENTCRPLSKKCRLIVEFGGNLDRSSTEDIASTSTTISETMASKVCPVCKTFSSSSNTTLNAHIDQCLAAESTPKWTSDSKLIRHRIKPRKIRLMVDIYTTALPCTLEELDRRNGTSWAAVSCLPRQEVEKSGNSETINEGKNMRVSQVHPEDVGDIGPVYIDANGTKLRMLSKFDDQPPVSKVREVIEAREPQKGDKGSKYISKKMRKRLAQKHHKFLKFAPQSKTKFSHKAHGSQIVEEECEGEAKSCEEEHMVSNKTKPSDSVTLRPWVCSKPRGLTKKTSQEGHQPVRCNWHLPQDLLSYNDQPFSGDTQMDKNVAQKFTYLPENSISSAAKNDEKSLGRKRMGNLWGAVKPTSFQLENCDTSMNDIHMMRPSDSSLLRKRTFDANNADTTCIASTKLSRDANAITSQRMHFSTSRKLLRVNGQSSVTESVPGKVKKVSAIKKSHLCFMKKRNEEGVSRKDQEYDLSYHNEENQDGRAERAYESLEMNTVLEPSLHFSDHNVQIIVDSSVGAGDDFLQKSHSLDSAGNQVDGFAVVLPSSNSCDERSAIAIKSMDSEIYKLSNSLNALQSVEDYRRLLEVDPIPIPGPPGSFLPSPRDMGSEDFQCNSSLTIHSSLDQHDHVVDGASSDSPMSAASTISTADRSNFKYFEPSSSVGRYDMINSAAASAESSLQSVDTVDKRAHSLKNDQPCCCQRKERLPQGVDVNFQESQLLRRRKMASMAIPTGGNQLDFNFSNLRSENLDVRGPPSSCFNPGFEKTVVPVMKPLASPCASNPVLRLMGKNLLVVNKDDDTSEAPHDSHHLGSQGSVIFSQSSCKPVANQYYEGGFSNSFDARLPVNAQLPSRMFQDQRTDYCFASSFQHAESSQNPVKEIIVLDSDPVHPFSYYDQSKDHRLVAEWVKEHNASCHATPAKPGPVRSGVMHLNPFTAASSSSSPGHIRSAALHYSPAGFS